MFLLPETKGMFSVSVKQSGPNAVLDIVRAK